MLRERRLVLPALMLAWVACAIASSHVITEWYLRGAQAIGQYLRLGKVIDGGTAVGAIAGAALAWAWSPRRAMAVTATLLAVGMFVLHRTHAIEVTLQLVGACYGAQAALFVAIASTGAAWIAPTRHGLVLGLFMAASLLTHALQTYVLWDSEGQHRSMALAIAAVLAAAVVALFVPETRATRQTTIASTTYRAPPTTDEEPVPRERWRDTAKTVFHRGLVVRGLAAAICLAFAYRWLMVGWMRGFSMEMLRHMRNIHIGSYLSGAVLATVLGAASGGGARSRLGFVLCAAAIACGALQHFALPEASSETGKVAISVITVQLAAGSLVLCTISGALDVGRVAGAPLALAILAAGEWMGARLLYDLLSDATNPQLPSPPSENAFLLVLGIGGLAALFWALAARAPNLLQSDQASPTGSPPEVS